MLACTSAAGEATDMLLQRAAFGRQNRLETQRGAFGRQNRLESFAYFFWVGRSEVARANAVKRRGRFFFAHGTQMLAPSR